MKILTKTLDELNVGSARSFGGLTVYPLLGADGEPPSYRTLDEALEEGSARVTEIGRAGNVPELSFVNEGDRPVLLLDGEELTGAKQNRVLNLTILAPAGKTIVIPVSCVEAGRWSAVSDCFEAADHVMYVGGRQAKMAQVSGSLAAAGSRRSDQSAIWSGVADLMRCQRVESSTDRMDDVFRAQRREMSEYVAAFPAVEGQVGAVFALGGRLRGVELFDREATLRKLLPKLVRSWALDALEHADRPCEVAPAEAVRSLLEGIAACRMEVHEAVGLGRDVRLNGERLAGGALVHDDRVVHLCVFRMNGSDGGRDGFERFGRNMARASWRGRRRA
jgi:hypothetical protein